jgi:Asp-tRNA(Asn)/Glu-tRNA(Gln) amidotransferase A subunit family amidase
MEQAKQADEAFAKVFIKSTAGIPYGLKDLFAKGTRTTYGTPPFKDQVIDEDAFVYQQLKDAGAVLIAKLSMGELAMDDIWFGGQTKTLGICNKVLTDHPARHRQPLQDWYPIGTETYGSIVAPSAVVVQWVASNIWQCCPNWGMNLAWTSDRIGPICRSAEDCAMVFAFHTW